MLLQQVIGKSEQILGCLQQKWGELTDNQFEIINGRRKSLLGKIKELNALTDAMTKKILACSKKTNP